jgi:hypothetical protein
MRVPRIFPKSQKKDELMVVFHVGSSSVGGAVFSTNREAPKILFSATEHLRIEEKVDPAKLLASALQALDKMARELHSQALGAPTRVFCMLASPWYLSETRTIKYRPQDPFIFTEKLADELIQKEIQVFGEENAAKYPNQEHAVRPIELKNIQTILNGYGASRPLNQKANELEMIIFISLASESALQALEDTIHRYFHTGPVKFSSFAMASFTVIRDTYHTDENFLLVDIGGEVTEIFMTKKNVLRESISYPLGKNFLIRGVARELGCTLDEASSLISLAKDGHAAISIAKKLDTAISKLKSEWLNKFQESLANLSKDISIPSKIFIVVDRGMVEFFQELIKSEQFSQYTLAESKFEVAFLSSEVLHQAAQFDEEKLREPFLVIDSVYINRFLINSAKAGRE